MTCYEFVRRVEVALSRGGLNDLLLDTWPFNSKPESYGQLGCWDYLHLQRLLDSVDSLVYVFHHPFDLGLLTHHLGKINISLLGYLLFSRLLRRI